ncbi:CopD family protein [Xanthomonas campestris pv. pennamericanum]|uniref:CopD family protein n=1 Tax=Xanthomonas euvesicatoria TaxID=456327 RepID=UPI001C44377F|nr:CopD family protein [Xanthomonas euvesicatoria]MBV6809231.1 CopD family protein [Xanthomonas campestris pv. pennamericanum]MCC4627244.1 CopD family protein [Xanthomonas campestris pv. nigromaculans]
MTLYLWIKTFHLLFVIAWMAAVFYLPRILVNIAEAGSDTAVRARLVLMGRRLYTFGHSMLGLALLLGAVLWQGYRVIPDFPTMVAGGWLHAKLFAVALILAHYIVAGRWVKGAEQGHAVPSGRALRWFNEVPVILLIGVIWLVLAKPF